MGYSTKIKVEDSLFSKIIKIRDNWTCQKCGTKHHEGSMGLHNSHFIGRANKSTRFEPDNCDSMCFGCHQYLETHKATLYRDWKIEQLGEDRFVQLIQKSNKITKFGKAEAKEMRKVLRVHLQEMESGAGTLREFNC